MEAIAYDFLAQFISNDGSGSIISSAAFEWTALVANVCALRKCHQFDVFLGDLSIQFANRRNRIRRNVAV
ncbi:MAG: hypothetical protein R2843_00250 [Thermomicrobiales bacterium]